MDLMKVLRAPLKTKLRIHKTVVQRVVFLMELKYPVNGGQKMIIGAEISTVNTATSNICLTQLFIHI